MRKNKLINRTSIFFIILFAFMSGFIFLLTGNKYIYGSGVDWINQHSVLPDFFRQTFYRTKDLFPEFSLGLGAGQNAYNFAYYGYLNPVILISYFFPWIPMRIYVAISSIITVFVSIVLYYRWISSGKNFRPMVCYISTILFACAAPLTYHSHKQIMYMSYMPFLILALIGVDRLYNTGKKGLLIVNITMMFLTSYFFGVSGTIVLTVYAIYKYLDIYKSGSTNNQMIKRPFLHYASNFFCCSMCGILMACIILLPTLSAILAGRSDAARHISIISLFKPALSITTICYSPYGMGTVGILIPAVIFIIFFQKKVSDKFLGVVLFVISYFPIARYIINGTLYTRGKALIPFLPIAIFVIALFIEKILTTDTVFRKLIFTYIISILLIAIHLIIKPTGFTKLLLLDISVCTLIILLALKLKKNALIFAYLSFAAVLCCVISNYTDTLVKFTEVDNYYNNDKTSIVTDALAKDNALYRTVDICQPKATNNRLIGANYNTTGFYSSVFNKNYINFCNYDITMNNPSVNDISSMATPDTLFNRFMGVKYIVSDGSAPAGYNKINSAGNFSIYKADSTYSLGFASDNVMGINEYLRLSPEDRQLALLQYVIDDKDREPCYHSRLERVDMDTSLPIPKNKDGYYHIKTGNARKSFSLKTPDNLKKYVYIVKTHLKGYSPNRSLIIINGMQNCLSGKEASYPNKNFDFKYVISSNKSLKTLKIVFGKNSDFEFSDFEIYKIKYSDILKMSDNMSMMTNLKFTNNNTISGKISLTKDSLFTTTIPYDDGFTAYVDNKKISYKKTDNAFIGFDLPGGNHEIRLVYHAPYAKEGKILTVIGILLFLILEIGTIRKRKK